MAVNVKDGTWGISEIIQEVDGGFTCAAIQNNPTIPLDVYYPPLDPILGQYENPYALIQTTAAGLPDSTGTTLVPLRIDVNNFTIGDLNTPQRNNLRNFCDTNFPAYSWTDWDGSTVNAPAFDFSSYPLTTLLRDLILGILTYFGHSDYRPRPTLLESHNTEYTDNFGTDPSSRWTTESGSAPTWDSGNSEYDINYGGGDVIQRYSANSPGSIEHESQVTCVAGTASTDRTSLCGNRHEDTGVNDCYCLYENADGTLNLTRFNAGTRSVISNPTGPGLSTGDFRTFRLAASGTAGSNVVLDGWYTTHGTSKPSDPGWYGVDGSPTFTYTDTAANRLDDSTHSQGGIAGRDTSDYDTRHCYFKVRAISDRGGGGGTSTPQGIHGIDHGWTPQRSQRLNGELQ